MKPMKIYFEKNFNVIEKKKNIVRKIKNFTINFGPQHPAVHGVVRLLLEHSGETVVKRTSNTKFLDRSTKKKSVYRIQLNEKTLDTLRLLKAYLDVLIVNNFYLLVTSVTIIVRIIIHLSINDFPDIEPIISVQKTLCMDLPPRNFNAIVDTLLTHEVIGHQIKQGKLLDYVTEFDEVVVTLRREMRQGRAIQDYELRNPEVLRTIQEEIVPERWLTKQLRLRYLQEKIAQEYYKIMVFLFEEGHVNPYKKEMQDHIKILLKVINNVTKELNDNLFVRETLMNFREMVSLPNGYIPDNITIPIDGESNSTNSVMSKLTLPDEILSSPPLKDYELIYDLFLDEGTRPKLLETDLPTKLSRLMKITLELDNQFYEMRRFRLYHNGDTDLILQNPIVQTAMRRRLLPENWDTELENLKKTLNQIESAYLQIEETTQENGYPYFERIEKHKEDLKLSLENTLQASRNLQPLKNAMIKWRSENDIL